MREDSYSKKPNLMQILERMNKVYNENGDRADESTDWVHYFYQPSNNRPASYWEDIRQLSYKYYNEDGYRKKSIQYIFRRKKF